MIFDIDGSDNITYRGILVRTRNHVHERIIYATISGGKFRRGVIDKPFSFPKFPQTFQHHLKSSPTMAKRKRSSISPSPEPSKTPDLADRALKNEKRLCNRSLGSAKKALVVALRLGAGFERQKHSRRKKTAQVQKNAKALERLQAEYSVLKGLDMEKVADQQLRRTVGKVKSLKDQEALKEFTAGVEKTSTEPATLNVLARLYKVAAVKKVVDDAIEELKGIFTPSNVATSAPKGDGKDSMKRKKTVNREDKDDDTDMLDINDEDSDPFTVFSARIAAPSSAEDDSEGPISDDERPPSIGGSDSEHDPGDDLDADSESEEAASFDGFSGDESGRMDRRIAPPSDMSDAESEAPSTEPSKPTTKAKSLREKPTSSAFLPTLSHATYIAGSDSDASDLSADFAPRKNRRGQRARQKIAEAKFGAKAKHLEKENRKTDWDPKRGAVGGYGPLQSGENAIPLGRKEVKKRDDKGELHPSWQAAKEAKERKMIKIDVGGKGVGTKVVFD
jgi:hypothetical protein